MQLDGYLDHNTLARPDRPGGPVTRALCWAHARRKLKEVCDSSASPIALADLKRTAKLYAIKEKIRGEAPATRQSIRWEQSVTIVNAFDVWLDQQRSRVSLRSRLGEKLAYIANRWDGLLEFLHDGRVEIDSNLVENRIRPLRVCVESRTGAPALASGGLTVAFAPGLSPVLFSAQIGRRSPRQHIDSLGCWGVKRRRSTTPRHRLVARCSPRRRVACAREGIRLHPRHPEPRTH